MKKYLAFTVILTVVAVILCGSFCLIQSSLHPHCTNMSHNDQAQVNAPESKIDLKAQPNLLAVIDPAQIKEACGTKNMIHKPRTLSDLPPPSLVREQIKLLVHSFTGSKDFI